MEDEHSDACVVRDEAWATPLTENPRPAPSPVPINAECSELAKLLYQ